MKQIAYLSIGSNIGDKIEQCRFGIKALSASDHSRVLKQSRFYRTSPVDYEDQDWFVNAAVKIETDLPPRSLLKDIQKIQAQAGRKPDGIRFGPRVLDLDIIFYDALVMNSGGLEIPHPRMHKRRFVLQPICDIDPFIIHPILKKDMRSLLKELKDSAQLIEEIQ